MFAADLLTLVLLEPSDPNWAMYSIMMDSAYYNYARQITGQFGLAPPPVKQVFTYVGG